MQKRQSDVRRPPVPIFAPKRPRTALLAHPNNSKTNNESCPAQYTGSSHAKPTNQQWGNTRQNQQQRPQPSRQQNANPQSHYAPSWPQQQQPSQGNSTSYQQHPNQGNSTWGQQEPNQGDPTSWQQQQPYHQAHQGPGSGTYPQMNAAPSWPHGAQGNQPQPQPQYGQSILNMSNDWQGPPSYGNQSNRQASYQGPVQPPQQRTPHQQQAAQYHGNRTTGQALKQTTMHQSFKHTITPRKPQSVSNQPVASHQGDGFSGYGFNNAQGQAHEIEASPSPRYGETPSRMSSGQQKTCTVSQQPWGMVGLPNQVPFTPSDNRPHTAHNQGLDKPQTTTSHVTKARAPDNSLKLLSATVQGMQHWSRYREKTALIFELIGRVDSAVRNDPQSSYREFLLKDDKDQAVRCVFFEIDRPFPHLVRGQFYRCVGTYEPGNQRMRCVSVRSATGPERKLHRVCVTASDRAMRDWTSSTRES